MLYMVNWSDFAGCLRPPVIRAVEPWFREQQRKAQKLEIGVMASCVVHGWEGTTFDHPRADMVQGPDSRRLRTPCSSGGLAKVEILEQFRVERCCPIEST